MADKFTENSFTDEGVNKNSERIPFSYGIMSGPTDEETCRAKFYADYRKPKAAKKKFKLPDFTDKIPTPINEPSWLHQRATWVLLFVTIILSLANTTQLWTYHHQAWVGARRSQAAKNYLRYGYLKTKLAPLDNLGYKVNKDGEPDKYEKYWHHPPFANIYLSFFYGIFGESTASARMSGAVLSLLTFLFFWFSLRKHWGDVPTFYGLLMLTFIPIYGSYLNFVNYELIILCCMAGMILTYEKWLESKKIIYAGILFALMFFGAYTDYPMFIWAFFFWLFTGFERLVKNKNNWKFHAIYVGFVFLVVALVIFQLLLWKDSLTSFEGLFSGRNRLKSKTGNAFIELFTKWKYYYGFFGPFVFTFTLWYLGDLIHRSFLRRITRGDLYVLALGCTGITYVVALKQGAFIHEFFIWYVIPFLGLASGYGLYRFTQFFRFEKKWKPYAIGGLVCLLMVAWSVPVIHMKRTNPAMNFTKNIIKGKPVEKYDYDVDIKIAAQILRESCKPEDSVLIHSGLPTNRWEMHYYIDRDFKSVRNPSDFANKKTKKKWKRYWVGIGKVSSSFLKYLTEEYKFIVYKSNFIFDLTKKDFDKIIVKRQVVKERSDIARFFTSMVHGNYEIVDDPWLSLDYAIKFDKKDSMRKYRELIKDKKLKPDNFEAASAYYNNLRVQGKKSDIKDVMSYVKKPKKPMKFGDIEMLGYKFGHRVDGRPEGLFALRTYKDIQQNFVMMLKAKPKHKDEKIRKAIGRKDTPNNPIIPMSYWKPNLIYYMRANPDWDPGEYNVDMHWYYRDSLVVENPSHSKSHFTFTCMSYNGFKYQEVKTIDDFKKTNKKLSPSLKSSTSEKGNKLAIHGAKTKILAKTGKKKAPPKPPYKKNKKIKPVPPSAEKINIAKNRILNFVEKQNRKLHHPRTTMEKAKKAGLDKYFDMTRLGKEFIVWGLYGEKNRHGKYEISILVQKLKTSKHRWAFEFWEKRKSKYVRGSLTHKRIDMYSVTQNLKANQFFWIKSKVKSNPVGSEFEMKIFTETKKHLRENKTNKNSVNLSKSEFGIRWPFEFLHKLIIDPFFK